MNFTATTAIGQACLTPEQAKYICMTTICNYEFSYIYFVIIGLFFLAAKDILIYTDPLKNRMGQNRYWAYQIIGWIGLALIAIFTLTNVSAFKELAKTISPPIQ